MLSSGIISYANITDYEGIVEVFAKCFYDPLAYDAYLFTLMDYFDADGFNKDLLAQCAGKTDCQATISNSYFAVPEDKKQAGQFAFAQVACKSSDEILDNKMAAGLVSACFGLWICLMWAYVMSFLYAEAKIDD